MSRHSRRFGPARVMAALCGAVLTGGFGLAGGMTPAARERFETAVPAAVQTPGTLPGSLSAEAQGALVRQYCLGCHSDRGKAGGLSLASFEPTQINRTEHDARVAEKMIRKLRAGMMPPPTARRPDPVLISALAEALETRMDLAAVPTPGRRTFQRLNRAEYAQVVRDLLDLDVDVEAFLPSDTISSGFDNIADVQSFSPTLMAGYLRAASEISRLAVGDPQATPQPTTYRVRRAEGQMRHVEGTPFGTRGGLAIEHVFPADGDYVLHLAFFGGGGGGTGELFGGTTITSTDEGEQIEISVNGNRVALFDVDGWMHESDPNGMTLRTPPIRIPAGPHRVSAAFVERYAGPVDDLLTMHEFTIADPRIGIGYGVTALPHLRELTIVGPQNVTGLSETPSRRRIFTCRPDTTTDETACAREILTRLATKAYREPVSPSDLGDLMRLYTEERASHNFDAGIRLALKGILANPRFLLRVEQAPSRTLRASETYPIRAIDLASRLSFFLWGTVPDADLMVAASDGRLASAEVIEQQVRRMLTDRRAEALSTRFASQWLRLQDVEKITPQPELYPQFDAHLADSYVRETELLFDSVVRDDRSVLELLTADYSYVNERIARHYGIPNVTGSHFRRVALPLERRGILGHGSVLMQTSVADRTSAVLRGKWVMEVLLGAPPPPPPIDVPDLEATANVKDGQSLTTRERLEQHRANPACTSCHQFIDPPGMALENFDVTGQWRINDNGRPVDAAGQLYDGTPMDGPAGLREGLLKHSDVVLWNFTEQLMTYALGRRTDYYDMPTVRAIVREAGRQDYRLSAFILGVVNSPAFRMSTAEPVATEAGADSGDLNRSRGRDR